MNLEKDPEWKTELSKKFSSVKKEPSSRCRFYFKDPMKLFTEDFDVEFKMNVKIPLSYMKNSQTLKKDIGFTQ
jgi:hypothetical protein